MGMSREDILETVTLLLEENKECRSSGRKEETDMIKMQNVRKVYPGFDFELSMEIPEEESPD